MCVCVSGVFECNLVKCKLHIDITYAFHGPYIETGSSISDPLTNVLKEVVHVLACHSGALAIQEVVSFGEKLRRLQNINNRG